MLWSNQVPNAPACRVECFTRGPNGDCEIVQLGREGSYARKWDVVEAVIDFVGKDYDVVLDA
jgi:hypothetical protein